MKLNKLKFEIAQLKEILKQKKITVRQLAKDSGISENTLYGIIKRDNKTLEST